MTLTRRTALLALGSGLVSHGLFAQSPVQAAERVFYKQATLDQALQANRPVVLEIWASWCPTCKVQEQALKRLATQPKYEKLLMITADFDVEQALLRRFRIASQSTLIAFNNGTEIGRAIGITREADIAALLDRAV